LLPFVDLSSPQAADQLARQLAASTRVRGVRQILNVHADPQFDYVGRHYLREAQWQCGMALLERHGLIFSANLPLTNAGSCRAGQALSGCALCPEPCWHVCGSARACRLARVAGWHAGVGSLLECAGEAERLWHAGPPLDGGQFAAAGVRGHRRFWQRSLHVCFNFPVCSLYTSYRRLWQAYDNLLAQAAAHERRAMFADNAWQFYQLGD
jgi:hypothetical protein